MKLLACCTLFVSAAFAGVITNPFVQIDLSPSGANSTGTVTTTINNGGGGYTLGATACIEGYCPGEGTPGQGPSYTVSDPLTFRTTALTLTCVDPIGCDAASIEVFFDLNPGTPGPGTTGPVTLSIDGTAPANFSFIFSGQLESDCACTPVTSGNQTITADNSGNFNQTFNLGMFGIGANTLKANLTLGIASMGFGQVLSLPNSAVLTFGSTSAVPEPKTLALMLAGFGALGLMLYKRRA